MQQIILSFQRSISNIFLVFSMFKIRIIFDGAICGKDVPEAVGIVFINCEKLLVVCYTIKI